MGLAAVRTEPTATTTTTTTDGRGADPRDRRRCICPVKEGVGRGDEKMVFSAEGRVNSEKSLVKVTI